MEWNISKTTATEQNHTFTHSRMEPILADYALNHLVFHLHAQRTRLWRDSIKQLLPLPSHLIFAVWVRSAAGAIETPEVVVVAVLTVHRLLVLSGLQVEDRLLTS